jgi:replication factor A2
MFDLYLFQENTPDSERTALIRENIYVRVHGHVRAFGGKRSVVAFRVAPIVDVNEVTTHILEVVHAHIYLTRSGGTPMVKLWIFNFCEVT